MIPMPGPRIYLDTNVFIDAFEGRGADTEAIQELLLAPRGRAVHRLVTSELTLSEALVKPLELKRADLVPIYEGWTATNAQIEAIPVTRTILRAAAALRAMDRALKLPDAIHLATALEAGCTDFLTRDAALRSPQPVKKVITTEANVRRLLKEIADYVD